MSIVLFRCDGGDLVLPTRASLLVSRENGGNLVVHPPRPVWERSELTPDELTQFAFLVSAAGRAMIDRLPQLRDGCVNYWEAGNWALNDEAEPRGRKAARAHRAMHLHLLGRSPASTDPSWRWGESPRFPAFAEKDSWAARFERLTPEECGRIVAAADARLRDTYRVPPARIRPWTTCAVCRYPTAADDGPAARTCEECRRA